jgi:hypothetical protein
MRPWRYETLLRRPSQEDRCCCGARDVQIPDRPPLGREPLLGQALLKDGQPRVISFISGLKEAARQGSEGG